MKRLFAASRRIFVVGVLAAVAVVIGAGYGYSAVTANSQTYTGCLQNGDLTAVAIGSTPVKACPKNATQISWSETGPPGAPGTDGTNGTNGTNGTDGVSVTSEAEPAGANCANGGSKFTAAGGVSYACNGAPGAQGVDGEDGEDGTDGTNGTNLVGSPCSLPDDTPGTVQMSVAANGAISFVCQTAGGGTDLCADVPTYPNATTHCNPATGTLSITCSTGFANGDNNITNGCETNVLTDPANCGAVGNVVSLPHATGGCVGGQAVIAACQGENYDVDGVTANGCERPQLLQAHTQSTAASVGSVSCADGSGGSISGKLYSDSRIHANPAIQAFNSATGSAPAWYRVAATGGFTCLNDYEVTFTTSGGSATSCYRLTLVTDNLVDTVEVSGHGSATMSGGSGSYSDNTNLFFNVEKICSSSVQEAIDYTIVFHL